MEMISFNKATGVFALHTRNSDYQMMIGEYGVLHHLYYGKSVGCTEITHRIIRKDIGFSGNPWEAELDRTFSIDVLPQEYTGYGSGDYRVSSAEVIHADGSNVLDLRYETHRIEAGKYSLPGLPAAFAEEEAAETLIITMKDTVSKVRVDLYYGVIAEKDIITRSAVYRNEGVSPISIERAMSMSLDFPENNFDLIHFYGRHCMERLTERQKLTHGICSVGSTRGMSSHHHNPFLILCSTDATEEKGECFGFTLLYSGGFLGEMEVDQMEQTRIVMGIQPAGFSWTLKSKESFAAPEVMMIYTDEGLAALSNAQHRAVRDHIIRSPYAGKRRPILINNWEATYFDFNEEKLYQIAKEAKEIGIEMLVMDDGWFGSRDDDYSGLGDWYVNETKLKGGLPALVSRISALDLKFGIWTEPEMISEDSDLYRAHPDWCLRIPPRTPNRSRHQLNLDITRPEVRDHIMSSLFKVLDSCPIDYVKWDMNRSLANIYSAALPPAQQGEVLHRYTLGLYDMLERLITRYPGLLLETCSGGGGRFDAGMLYYSPQIWCSDNTDAAERLKIQYGTSFGYPISTMGSHVSACPNHQTGRSVPFETRAAVAMAGTFGYELDLERITPQEKQQAKQQISQYKQIAPLILDGSYYRLSSSFSPAACTAWQFVSQDRRTSHVTAVIHQAQANRYTTLLKLKGLDPIQTYTVNSQQPAFTGAALMYAGLPLAPTQGDYQAVEFMIQAV